MVLSSLDFYLAFFIFMVCFHPNSSPIHRSRFASARFPHGDFFDVNIVEQLTLRSENSNILTTKHI